MLWRFVLQAVEHLACKVDAYALNMGQFGAEHVVAAHCGYGHKQAHSGGDERFGNAGRDRCQRNALHLGNGGEGMHEEQMRYAAEKVLGDLLPTLDNLDLALRYGSKSEACKDMLQGVAMTHKLLLDAVEKHGLKPLGEEGEEFDPNVHGTAAGG